MAAPSFTSFPTFIQPGPSQHREPDPPKKKKDKHQKSRPRPQQVERDFALDHHHRTPELFYSDYKGNKNAHYGGSDPASVPKYYLIAHNQVLGLHSHWTVVHRNNKGIEIAPRGRRKMPSLTDSKTRHLLAQMARPLSALPGRNKRETDENDEFLRVSGRPRKQDTQTYRAITREEAHAGSSDESSGSSASESEDSEDDRMVLTSHQTTLKSLEEKLRADPSSEAIWLSLLSQSISVVTLDSKNAVRARAEIAVSILSRAISAHPSNQKSPTLRLKYLKAGEEAWDDQKLNSEWEVALQHQSREIWIEWLNWRISKSKDGVERVVEDTHRVLTGLGSRDQMGQLRAQWRVAIALSQAGYPERAMALFQCQAELAFEIPQSIYGLPLPTQLDSLEEFWESEFPRIGEPNAKGWAAWDRAGRPGYSAEPVLHTFVTSNISDPYQRWAADEASADLMLNVPTRSTDDTEDPYSMILFSDIRPMLISLDSLQAKQTFRLIWLSFLGLYIPGFSASLSELPSENLDDRWAHTHLITPSYLRSIFPQEVMTKRVTADSHSGVLVGNEKQYSSGFGPVKNWGYGVLQPHDSLAKYGCTLWTRNDLVVKEEFVRRVFQQCRMGTEDQEWDGLALAFEAALNGKRANKLSRLLLSSDQESPLRWDVHASLERDRGRLDDARKVYQTVLESSPTAPNSSCLWWSWAEMEWLTGRSDAAHSVIMKSAGVEGNTGISVLRAKRALEENMRTNSQSSKEHEAWTKIRALLELLTSSPSAALSILDEQIAGSDPASTAYERLTVVALALLYHHGTTLRNPMPPAVLRDRTNRALEIYPSNSFVLGLFLENERGQGVWGKVREQLGEMIIDGDLKEKDVMRRVIEVWIESGWEHGRWQSEKERVRSGLSNAMQHERTRGSPILWRIFIEFEIIAGKFDRAKQLLFQAVRCCPLVKEFYLLAFGPLRQVFTTQELSGWAESMAERGLRVRKGLDEVLESVQDIVIDQGKGEDDYGEEDIEYNADELRRLRPY